MSTDWKALFIIVVVVGAIYIGVEPFAHSQMHPAVAPVDFSFKDLKENQSSSVNTKNGKTLFANNCSACHSLTVDNIPQMMGNKDLASAYGVVPPDLSDAGLLYDKEFFISFVKNPTEAMNLKHKFNETDKIFPMPKYDWLGNDGISDIYAYLKSIEKADISDKQVFESACVRCHDMRYAKLSSSTPKENIESYMGVIPPDLSTMYLSRGVPYLNEFINDPAKHLEGTAMPRVGLSEKAQAKIISFMQKTTDPKAEERETLGMRFIIYSLILAIVAWIWKIKIWSRVH